MIYENQKNRHASNALNVLFGMLLGGLAGAAAMLLLAPQSGKDTRRKIQKKGVELRDRTTELMDDTMSQLRTKADKMAVSGREKIKELTQRGQGIAVEQLEHVSEVAQAGKKAIQSP